MLELVSFFIPVHQAGTGSRHLQHLNIPMMDTETCRKKVGMNRYTQTDFLRPGQICIESSAGKDACQVLVSAPSKGNIQ